MVLLIRQRKACMKRRSMAWCYLLDNESQQGGIIIYIVGSLE